MTWLGNPCDFHVKDKHRILQALSKGTAAQQINLATRKTEPDKVAWFSLCYYTNAEMRDCWKGDDKTNIHFDEEIFSTLTIPSYSSIDIFKETWKSFCTKVLK